MVLISSRSGCFASSSSAGPPAGLKGQDGVPWQIANRLRPACAWLSCCCSLLVGCMYGWLAGSVARRPSVGGGGCVLVVRGRQRSIHVHAHTCTHMHAGVTRPVQSSREEDRASLVCLHAHSATQQRTREVQWTAQGGAILGRGGLVTYLVRDSAGQAGCQSETR